MTIVVGTGLLSILSNYLSGRGWYFDHDYFKENWGREATAEDLRQCPCWTVPQWGDYWHKPGHPEETSRRYETLREALSSQLMREEEPEKFGRYFGDDQDPGEGEADGH